MRKRPISPDATAHIPCVREALKIGLPGGTYDHVFYVADVAAKGPAMNDELHVCLRYERFPGRVPAEERRTCAACRHGA